jgi:hypothetical protein
MRTRGTLILLVLCVALACYVFLVERRRPSREIEEAATKVVLRLDAAAVTGLRYTFVESTIALARTGGRWSMVEPLDAPADEARVAGILAVVDSLAAERRIPAAEVDTVAAGTTAPWVRLVITIADSTRHEIAVGSMNPLGQAYYAQIDRGRELCLLPADTVERYLEPTVFSLRDRRLAPFTPPAARRIEIAAAARTLELAVIDGQWHLRRPDLPADQEAVGRLLDRFAHLEALAYPFSAPAAADLERAGISEPSWTALITGAGDSILARLVFGAPVPSPAAGGPGSSEVGPARYARGSGSGSVAIVADDETGALMPTLFSLRDKRLLELGPTEIDTLEVSGGGTTVLAARDTTGQFHQVNAATAEVAPPAGELDRLAAILPRVEVTRFADETATGPSALRRFGLDPAYVRLRLRLANGEARVVLLGHADPEGNGVFAHRIGTPGVVVVGHATAGDLIQLVYGGRALPPTAAPAPGL